MKKLIYADHAATTCLDADAFEAMKPFLLEEYANASQPYAFSRRAKDALEDARATIAGCIHAQPEEIYFTSGGTESDNWAVKGTVSPGDEIITSQIEHHAVLHACAAAQGVHTTCLPVTEQGDLLPGTLADAISDRTKLVSVMLANNEIGAIQPIPALAEIAHEHGALFHTDAVQAVGHVSIDVNELGVDLLSASAHKFNGPKGIGFLYVRRGTPIRPYLDGGAQESGLRAGTENVAAIAGMAVALRNSCDRMAGTIEHLQQLEQMLLEKLTAANLDYIRNGAARHTPGNISLSFRDADGEALLHRLDLMGICVSTGSACDSVQTQISHVLKAIRLPEAYARGTIRISLGYENTQDDVLTIARALEKILRPFHH